MRPATHWAYSNFGYCVLGRVIEKITGQTYENFVQQSILAPCGITDMRIAGNSYRDRAPNEVAYLGQFNENPYNMNVRRMDSHGGWIATPQRSRKIHRAPRRHADDPEHPQAGIDQAHDHARSCLSAKL